jgi:hypothetical protein
VKARPLMKTSVLRSRRVNLFKNHVHSIERPRRMLTHCYIVAFESRGTQTAFNSTRPTACAISSKKTTALVTCFVHFSDGGAGVQAPCGYFDLKKKHLEKIVLMSAFASGNMYYLLKMQSIKIYIRFATVV